MSDRIDRHRRACAGFGRVVQKVAGRWSVPTPCSEWDARGLLEHVIGFHEVLILRPLGVRAHRPKDDPVGRWNATEAAIFAALTEPASSEQRLTALPGADEYDLAGLLPALTTDVLIHTWDLARAVGADETLDADLVRRAYKALRDNPAALQAPGMFAPPVVVSDDADLQTKLLAAYGRRS